ncbi:MAG: fibronectin type III domain-containing protein [Bacteroidota bacterium]|nr:fibronectin type III domain-containing protein [Bacteroidota bacterium]
MKKIFTLFFFLALSSQLIFAAFSGGDGSASTPFLISNASDLYNVRNYLGNSTIYYFKQTADIDLSSYNPWTPIGSSSSSSTKFCGIFDGDNHKITGLIINSTSSTDPGTGLFGYVYGGTIKNLGIEKASVTYYYATNNGYTGILVGSLASSSTIQNCYTTGNCTGNGSVGGLVGLCSASTIKNSYSTADVTNSNANTTSYSGGFIGSATVNTSYILNCFCTGTVSGNSSMSSTSGLGSFVGNVQNGTYISYCYACGTITNSGTSTNLGGFAGRIYSFTGTFTSCFWNNEINSSITNGAGNGTAYSGITGASTSDMKKSSTYTNWDFVGDANGSNDYWNISTGYPYLNWCTAPGAPTIGTATAGDAQASVTFNAPSSNGGNAITGYTVTSNPDGKTGTGTSSPITVTGLTNGTAYTFTVTATNDIGTSSASAVSNSVTPKGSQTITFANPGTQFYGTTPTLTATASSGLTPTFTSSTTGVCTITSGGTLAFVAPGTCTINADQAGNSAYNAASTVTRSFSVNAVVAGAPSIGTATAGDGQASVTFTAPPSNGGSAITGYTVTSIPGGKTGTNTISPIAVTGLTNGTSYTFTVTATNGAGTSAASAASNSVTPGATTSSWIGTGNWSTGTWSNGIPGTPTSVTITSSGTCTVDADATITNLTVSPGAALTISSGKTLTVTGTLTLDASSSALASLINNGTITAGTTVVKSYLTANQWHIVSPPVTGEAISSFLTDNSASIASAGTSTYYKMMKYKESSDTWNTATSGTDAEANYFSTAMTSANLESGTGYGLQPSVATSVVYKGALKNGDFTVNVTKNGNGWNCIGNPYSSSININAAGTPFLTENTSKLATSFACVYLWDQQASYTGNRCDYKIIGAAPISFFNDKILAQSYVAPGQGFFIKAASAGTISFKSAMQSHQNSIAVKATKAIWPAIRLKVTDNTDTTSTVVAFNNSMSKGLDPSYDAGLLRGTKTVSLYTRLVNDNGTNFAIQCLPDTYDSLIIPVGVESKSGSKLIFSAETAELPADCKLILEDKTTGTFTSLANGASYSATVDANSTGTGRFFLHTSSATTGNSNGTTAVDLTKGENLKVYAIHKVVYIYGSNLSGSTAKVYDLNGRSYGMYKLTSDNTQTLDESALPAGMYMVRIATADGKVNTFKVVME